MIPLRIAIITSAFIFLAFASPLPHVSAQVTGPTNTSVTGPTNTSGSSALLNPLQASTLQGLLQEILAFVVQIGSIILTVMLIYVGFLFVSARGAPEKVSQARSALLWTVVGGLLLLGASALATVITTTASSL